MLSGRVKIYKLSARGDQQILHLYERGDTFGEAAMWADVNFPAFAELTEDSRLLVVPCDTLREAIVGNADLALGMMAGLSAKLREFARLIEQLSLKEVPARLAGVLLRMTAEAGSNRVRLRQTKRELAAQIGTVAETLSRAMAKLKALGLIEVEASQITILDNDGLRDLAEQG